MSTTLPPEEDNEEARAEHEALEAPDPVLEEDEVVDLPELDLGDDLDDTEPIIDEPPTEPTDVPEDEAGGAAAGVSARFEVRQDKRTPSRLMRKPAWRWHLIAANGEELAHGEAHTREGDAWRAVGDAVDAVAQASPVTTYGGSVPQP